MCATPPSEPDVRISRIRLSSRQFLFRDWHFTPGSGFENHPGLEFRHRVFTPAVLDTVTGAANMRSDHADRFTQFSQGWASSTFLGLFANIVDFFRSPCSSRICLPTRLGSTPVTALHRYYAGSDSPPPLLPQRGIPASRRHTSGHSVANHLMQHCHSFQVPFLHLAISACVSPHEYGLHPTLAGSPRASSRIAFVSYGLSFPLPLLPTPPRGDAVTVEYKPERSIWRELSSPDMSTPTGVLA